MKKRIISAVTAAIFGTVGLAVFSFYDIVIFEDALLNTFMLESITYLLAAAALFVIAFCIKMPDIFIFKTCRREFLLILPAFSVAAANFPFGALFFGGAAITRTDAIPLFIIWCVLSALLEEIIYRGFLLTFLMDLTDGAKIKSALLSSLIFSVSHAANFFIGNNIGATFLQIGYTFLIGIMLAFVTLVTKNIWLPALVHAVFNIGGRILEKLGTGSPWELIFWILTIVCGVLAAIHILIYTRRELSKRQPKTETGSRRG